MDVSSPGVPPSVMDLIWPHPSARGVFISCLSKVINVRRTDLRRLTSKAQTEAGPGMMKGDIGVSLWTHTSLLKALNSFFTYYISTSVLAPTFCQVSWFMKCCFVWLLVKMTIL